MTNLKPCPNCFDVRVIEERDEKTGKYYVKCKACGVAGPNEKNPNVAQIVWNGMVRKEKKSVNPRQELRDWAFRLSVAIGFLTATSIVLPIEFGAHWLIVPVALGMVWIVGGIFAFIYDDGAEEKEKYDFLAHYAGAIFPTIFFSMFFYIGYISINAIGLWEGITLTALAFAFILAIMLIGAKYKAGKKK